MDEMGVKQRMEFATMLGKECHEIMKKAQNKCNKMLEKHGMEVSFVAEFRELQKAEQK
jgi:exonuclease VII small subunit